MLVINLLADSVIIPEIEFSEIAMQVAFGAVLVNTLHASLEYAEEVFAAVHVDSFVFR